MSLEINLAYNDIDKVRLLFSEYTTLSGVDFGFQNYDAELQNLPGVYAPPLGRLYIANYDGQLAGCIALRPLENNCCEMKRLFVRPMFRGKRIRKSLSEKAILDAKEMKYQSMLLDALTSPSTAVALYKKLGFYEIEPYCFNPLPNVIFLRLDL